MSEGFIPIWMSVGEAEHTLECLRELEDSDAGLPERPVLILLDALESEVPRSAQQMEAERAHGPDPREPE